jgi:nitroreductase/NAD-dependent dihydropyrimidine dehydrogenase PreA subunit
MITLEKDKCSCCGLCATICHQHCIQMDDGGPMIASEFCSTCTQCIAICPTQALAWNHTQPEAYERQRLPLPEQLDELFKERRSIRRFKNQKIDRSLLEEIVGYGTYAPTENFHLRAVIVDDEAILGELEKILMRLTRRIFRWVFGLPLLFKGAQVMGMAHTYLRSKSKVEFVVRRGHYFHELPAAFVLIVGKRKIPLSEASAQYALANMMYYAQAKGIGSYLCGNGQLFLDKNRVFRKRLGLGRGENVLGALFLGYPAIKFSNKVTGKRLPIQWNGVRNA